MVLNWIKKISGKTDKKQEKDTKKSTAKKAVVKKAVSKKSTAKKAVVKKAVVKKDKTVLQQNKDSFSKSGFLGKLFKGLGKSSAKISENITGVFTKRKLDKEAIQDLEDILIMSDMGVELSKKMANNLAKNKFEKEISDIEIKRALAFEIENVLQPVCKPMEIKNNPQVILIVGVNGSGKTTTIAKLAQQYVKDGKKVILGAGDTFRAAAVEQLQIWGKRIGCDVISKPEGSDAGALAYETVTKGVSSKADVIIIDTAGRLHNKEYLMEELKKIHRVIGKVIPKAPNEVVLVLDATVGQNGLEQVNHFKQAVNISGIIMTKLDGSAKGGVLVNIANTYNIPIYAVGVGETVDDLNSFTAKDFAHSLMGL
ncbi:MAG: signal recognition particle-docking protein FtsY [Alphaproteobacteria bacterium]|nr:signal recognition particle-docking protein FtsY [Alphaproteobacteria bacterium]